MSTESNNDKVIILSKKKYNLLVWLMWTILVVAIAKNYEYPNGDIVMYGDKYQRSINNMIYYLGIDIILLLWAVFANMTLKNIISWMLCMLGVGKIFDEFLSPYGYHAAEMIYDALIFVVAYSKYSDAKNPLKE